MNGCVKVVLGVLMLGVSASNVLADYADAADKQAMGEFKKSAFVKDLYVSPGVMNIGVIRSEKQWGSPTFAMWACGILKRNGSRLDTVRFVDVEAMVYQKKSLRQAEIVEFSC